MSRATVRKVFVTGLVVWIVGAVLLLLSARLGQSASGTLYEAGLLLAGFGVLLDVISWIMALAASVLLGRWGWFAVLLILGVLGLLLIVMAVYSAVGPTRRRTEARLNGRRPGLLGRRDRPTPA